MMTTLEHGVETHGHCPQLHDAVVLGPGLWEDDRLQFTLKDRRTGWYFRVGEHEAFLISLMDGRRNIDEMEALFVDRFRRRLTPAHWSRLFSLLGNRQLLVGSETPDGLEAARLRREEQGRQERSLLHARLSLAHPDLLLGRWAPRLGWLLGPTASIAGWLLLVACLVASLWHWGRLWPVAMTLWQHPGAAAGFVVMMWLGLTLHELGHGLVARYRGAEVTELGLMWRAPLLVAYCKADDVVLLHDRWHRAQVALAGPTVSLLVCQPFWPLWLATEGRGDAGILAAAMLTFGVLSALMNLPPVFGLDGYQVLNHALGARELERSGRRALVGAVRGHSFNGPAWLHRVYLVFGVFVIVVQTAALLWAAGVTFWILRGVVGLLAAAIVAGLVPFVVVVAGVVLSRRAQRRRKELPGAVVPFTPTTRRREGNDH